MSQPGEPPAGPAGEGSEGRTSPRLDGRLLVIAGLTGVAVAQPVLDVLGTSAATLRFHRVEGADLVAFALAVVVLPPVALWAVGRLAALVGPRAGLVVHLATVAVLLGAFGVLLTKTATDYGPVNLAAGGLAALVGSWAYLHFEAVGRWLKILAGANLLFLVSFTTLSPAADLVRPSEQAAADVSFDPAALSADGRPASVVMIVLDELPTQSVLTAEQGMDPVRFPNLASFAEQATWYRRFSTVSPFTQSAVPALLDGKDPAGRPVVADHPDNLFSLLADSHELIVSESLTKLCGFEACSGDAETGDPGPDWSALAGDAVDVWVEQATPGAAGSGESFADFAEQLDRLPDPGQDEQTALEDFVATTVEAQPERLERFLDELEPSDEPFLGYLHLVLPHQPWLLREDGSAYDLPGDEDDIPDVSSDWRARVTQQRHLLQAEYTDRLLGLILDRLKEIGEYDDSLVVVVSDHGAAFETDQSTRSIGASNLAPVAYAPLLIKAPGQQDGRVDDANLLSVDLLPTVADLLGTEPSWEVDGVAATDTDALDARGDEKYLYSYTDAFTYEFLGIERFDDQASFQRVLDGRFPTVEDDEDRLAGLYRDVPGGELIGRPASVMDPGEGEVRVRELGRLRQPGSEPLLAEVTGSLPGADDDDVVVVAVNGTVVGVSPVYASDDGDDRFVVLLPAGVLRPDRNELRVGVLRGGTAAVTEVSPVDAG